jgi:uncharacterized membrane protein
MKSHARLFGHPLHQMTVIFPAGLLAITAVFDLIGVLTDSLALSNAAYWTLVAGLLGAVLAMPSGWVDWHALPVGSRARRIGAWHGVGNGLLSIVFAASLMLRTDGAAASRVAIALSATGLVGLVLTAWLGGELVSRLGVGVDPNAHLDASNSLQAECTPLHVDMRSESMSEAELARFDGAYAAWKEATIGYESAMRRLHGGDEGARIEAQALARQLAQLHHRLLESTQPFFKSSADSL